MTFYDLDGNSLGTHDFIELYSKYYFNDNDKAEGIKYTQSSSYVENEKIMPILQGHIDSYSDFAKIMAWKIGKIKHKESQDKKKIIYASDWSNCEKTNPLRYKNKLDLKKLAKYICSNREELEILAIQNPQECLRRLSKVNISGIGTVYLITLLFFLSHGQYPIYDRFAQGALYAFKNDIKPNGAVCVRELPTKNSGGFANLMEGQYGEYIKELEALGVDYKNDRRVDRALWVYGHAFNYIKKK